MNLAVLLSYRARAGLHTPVHRPLSDSKLPDELADAAQVVIALCLHGRLGGLLFRLLKSFMIETDPPVIGADVDQIEISAQQHG